MDKRVFSILYVKSVVYEPLCIFKLNNKYFPLLKNGKVYGTGNNGYNR